MWEAAGQTPPPAPAPPTPPHRRELLLPVQVLLCAMALAAVLAARALELPAFARLRVAYTAAMAVKSDSLLGEQRHFTRFAQQAAEALKQAAAEVWAQVFPPQEQAAPAEAAPAPSPGQSTGAFTAVRAVHGQAPPAGSALQCYSPAFALAYPLPGDYVQNSPYGWRTEPVTGQGTKFHKGADLAAAEGTPVLAAAAGVVRSAGSGASYGNWLRILHPDGDETLYAHLQYLFVHAGQSVAMGQQLGTVGQTGHVTGPHLHFELLHQGVRYDPSEALQNAARAGGPLAGAR